MVAGHVDGVAELVAREDLTDMARLTLRAPQRLMRFVATKGSVALDGVSLTVNEVTADTFSVLIIPHTLVGHHARRGQERRHDQSRSRPDGALCGAVDGDEVAALVPAPSSCY